MTCYHFPNATTTNRWRGGKEWCRRPCWCLWGVLPSQVILISESVILLLLQVRFFTPKDHEGVHGLYWHLDPCWCLCWCPCGCLWSVPPHEAILMLVAMMLLGGHVDVSSLATTWGHADAHDPHCCWGPWLGLETCCSQRSWWRPWSTLPLEGMWIPVVCAATWNLVGVCGPYCHWRPCWSHDTCLTPKASKCSWSVLSSDTIWKYVIVICAPAESTRKQLL